MSSQDYPYRRVAGSDIQVLLLDDDQTIRVIDSKTNATVVELKASPRILAQFRGKTNYRAGGHSDSKINAILECLLDVPELQDYL